MTAPSADALYESAKEFARTAIDAHSDGRPHRAAVDATTALEHLAKASLARRSPALLADLNRGKAIMLANLLGLPIPRVPVSSAKERLRTIGVREALARVALFLDLGADDQHLSTLCDMRDGVVHAGADAVADVGIVVSFATAAEALLVDLDRTPEDLWGSHHDTVRALLADAKSAAEREARVALAAANKRIQEWYGGFLPSLRQNVMLSRERRVLDGDEDTIDCPACRYTGVAAGSVFVEWSGDVVDYSEDGRVFYEGDVMFTAERFSCTVCGLKLPTQSHMVAAGMSGDWKMQDVDPYDFDPDGPDFVDENVVYEAWGERD